MNLPAALSKLGAEALNFATDHPEIVAQAVDYGRALVEGRTGTAEHSRLKRSADAELRRRKAIAAAARKR
jgi:hypothetical protein